MDTELPAVLSAKDAAKFLKISPRQVKRLAANIPRKRFGVGGPYQYPIAALKQALKEHPRYGNRLDAALAPRPKLPAPIVNGDGEGRARALTALDDRKGTCVNARFMILEAGKKHFVDLTREAPEKNLPRPNATDAEKLFVALFNNGAPEFPMELRVAAQLRRGRLSPRTLQRWRNWREREGLARLAGRHGGGRPGKVESNPELKETLEGLLGSDFGGHLGRKQARNLVATALGWPRDEHGIILPGAPAADGAIYRFLDKYRREYKTELMAYHRPADFRSLARVKFGTVRDKVSAPNEEWQIDGSPSDLQLEDSPRRWQIINIFDVAPHRGHSLLAPSESGFASGRLIRRAVIEWGKPSKIRGDNGAGFLSDYLQAILADLGIIYEANPPRRPELKPHIESFNKSQSHELLEILPGYGGHSVAGGQALPSRQQEMLLGKRPVLHFRLTAAELQERLDQWNTIRNNRPLAALDGLSPNEFIAQWAGPINWVEDLRALDLLLGERSTRVILRDGLHLDGTIFVAKELAAHVNERVLVIRDGDDMGQVVVYRELQRGRRFLCIARNVDRLGVSRREVAVVAKQLQGQVVGAFRAHMRRLKRAVRPERVVDQYLENGAAAALPVPRPQLALMHTTPALEAASLAADAIADELRDRRKLKGGVGGYQSAAENPDPDDGALDELYLAIRAGRELPAWAESFLARCGDGQDMAPAEWAAHWETLPEYSWFRKREMREAAAREATAASVERLQRIASAARDVNEMRRRNGAY